MKIEMKEGQKMRIDSIVDSKSLKDHGQGDPVLEERRSLGSCSIAVSEGQSAREGRKAALAGV